MRTMLLSPLALPARRGVEFFRLGVPKVADARVTWHGSEGTKARVWCGFLLKISKFRREMKHCIQSRGEGLRFRVQSLGCNSIS
mmetsp:Transcript_27194/g.68051  ORF Transcript_27194/g.68051 Transcript_27194/m.68051 type:complete len:84 (+) Transcript_27194:221-472(+)